MPRIALRILMALFVSPFLACSSDPTASADAGATGGTGGNGGMSGASGGGGAAGAIDAGDASCPSTVTDASPPCKNALTSDIFDPGEVYLSGGLLAHVRCPNIGVRGSDCTAEANSYIRPTDGRLLYRCQHEPGPRELHMDGCLYVAGAANDQPRPEPSENDPLLLGACPGGTSPAKFLVSPEGFFMLNCADNTWRDIGGAHVYLEPGDPLLHIGYGNLALTTTRVIDLATGAGLLYARPAGIIYAIRAVPPDKFWIALRLNADASQALLEVDRGGAVRQLGTFPTPPSGIVVGSTGRLDKSGALYQITARRTDTMVEDIIIRRDIGGTFEVVYEESSDPLVRVDGSQLVTGP